MQHYPSASPSPVGTAVHQYGVATPSGSVECKPPAVIPACRLPPQHVHAGGRVAHVVAPHAATAAPVVAAPTPTNAKLQSQQFQYLPRFQPPSFEGANGMLPCPDSPGSTPRGVGSDAPAERIDTNGQFALGTIVEYKSRSSGSWIAAKVEGFDESTQTYRLDVQPHARPDRVRPRICGDSMTVEWGTPKSEPFVVRGERGDFGERGGRGCAPAEAQLPRHYIECGQTAAAEATGAAEERSGKADGNSSWLVVEVEALKKKVLRLQTENEALHERLMQEAALKDQYFSELCVCHEQLLRARGSTPR